MSINHHIQMIEQNKETNPFVNLVFGIADVDNLKFLVGKNNMYQFYLFETDDEDRKRSDLSNRKGDSR